MTTSSDVVPLAADGPGSGEAPLPGGGPGLGRRAAIGIGLGLLVYASFAAFRDFSGVGKALSSVPLWAPLAACALSLINYVVRFPRWQRYLTVIGSEVSGWRSFIVYLSGLSLTVSPGKVGEAMKSWLLRDLDGTPIAKSAPIVLAERLTDLFGFLVLIALFGFWSGSSGSTHLPMAALALLLGAGLAALFAVERLRMLLLRLVGRLPVIGSKADRFEAAFQSSSHLLAPRELALPTVLATLGWGLECFGCWVIAVSVLPDLSGSLPGTLSLASVGYAFAVAAVAGALVFISPGGLLVTEGVLAALLTRGYIDAGMETAGAAAMAFSVTLVTRLCTLWFAMLLGWLALAVHRRSRRSPEHREFAS